MTALYIDGAIAILLLISALVLTHRKESNLAAPQQDDAGFDRGLLDDPVLNMAERLFDGGDSQWLRNDLGFPHLAKRLEEHRKALALRWLRAVRHSVFEMMREPQTDDLQPGAEESTQEAPLPFRALHFHSLLLYAELMVRMFGPCHRLIPPLSGFGPGARIGMEKVSRRCAGESQYF